MSRLAGYGLFVLVLMLGGYLRCAGLTWGLESGYGHVNNYQPDEFISLRGVQEIDYAAGKLKVPGAYFEGTFNYYLWALPLAVRDWVSHSSPKGRYLAQADNFRFALFSGRIISVVIDLLTTCFIVLTVTDITGSLLAGLVSGYLYAIIPMQVIYGHFMRPHLLSNLLCAMVVWLSFRWRQRHKLWLLFLAGVLSGLGMATRFPVGIIATVPCLILLFEKREGTRGWRQRMVDPLLALLRGPIWWLSLGFVIGLLVGEPMLLFDTRQVIDAITHQSLNYVPPGATHPFDLVPVWKYVKLLIPYAMYPLLWVVAYGAVIYLCFRRSLYDVTLPLVIFTLLYSYPMAKAYFPGFARQVMLLLPIFCILIGVTIADLYDVVGRRKAIVIVLITLIIAQPSVLFDLAYVWAMQRVDARTALRDDLRKALDDSTASIGVSDRGGYFYSAMPAVVPLKSEKIKVEVQHAPRATDFFVLGIQRPIRSQQLNVLAKAVEKQGHCRLVKIYRRGPSLCGRELDLSAFPPDMTYPFVSLLLFRCTKE